ncbi:MAG: hypothetical protein RLZZ386_1, partial [Planctomycetota bacterium]
MLDNARMMNVFSQQRRLIGFIGVLVVCGANALADPPVPLSTPTSVEAADSLSTEVRRVITVDGVKRTYLAHIPASVDRTKET